jgi:hypothetical protein
MKLCSLLTMLLVSTTAHAAEPFTNHLAVHLLANRGAWSSNRTLKPYGLDLIAKPIISDGDFVTFDVTNQTFTTTADAAQRLNGQFHTSLQPIPFVLVASGEPIYVGMFEPQFKAYVSFDVPVVKTDQLLHTNGAFWIEMIPTKLAQETNVLHDPRIISAVQKMFAHEKK